MHLGEPALGKCIGTASGAAKGCLASKGIHGSSSTIRPRSNPICSGSKAIDAAAKESREEAAEETDRRGAVRPAL
jgi:hypothetical protein